MSKYARDAINQLQAYVPGEQPKPGEKVIKLNTNENPYPPAPGVAEAIKRYPVDWLRKYSQPLADTFREAASEIFEIDPEMIIAGNGSDELIDVVFRTFVGAGDAVAYPVPTYSYYPCQARMQEANLVEVPFGENFELPAEALLAANARVVFIANPNAPSGTLIEPAVIEEFARKCQGVVVVDEAYGDFAESNCLELAKRLPNVIVMRTLSKGYGLAGLRFGFAFASKELIDDMMKVRDSYSCDSISIVLATEAIRDQAYLRNTVAKIREQRARLTAELRSLGFAVRESQSNFVWATLNTKSTQPIYRQLKQAGILVRYFDKPGLQNGLRITVGLPEENGELIEALKRIMK
jgi:histidinol-phosphate aminotransferase